MLKTLPFLLCIFSLSFSSENCRLAYNPSYSSLLMSGSPLLVSQITKSSYLPNDFNSLRKKAITGSVLLFCGMALDYGLLPVFLNMEVEEDDIATAMLLLLPAMIISGLKISGPIVACIQPSKAYDNAKAVPMRDYRNHKAWGFYAGGWGFGAVALILNLANTLGQVGQQNPESNDKLVYASIGVGVGRDIMWTIACITSMSYVKKTRKAVEEKGFSIIPRYNTRGDVGLSLYYEF